MTTSRALRLAAGLTLALLVAACAQTPVRNAGSETTQAFGNDEVVLRVELVGGFTSATWQLTRLPMISVYGDGRVFTEGPQVTIYPGPALPNVQVQKVSAVQVAKLAGLAEKAGVGSATDFGRPSITDVPDTKFTLLTATGVKTTSVYALSEGEDASGLTAEQKAARAKLKGLIDQLTDLDKTLGEGVGKQEIYTPTRMAAVVTPWQPADDGLTQPEVAWPGPALPGDVIGNGLGLHCVVASGDQLSKVLSAGQKANQRTPWTSGGQRWLLTFRPLLPDESSCADLVRTA